MPSATESVIHDLGYQRYTGARLGRWYAIRSLYLSSLRASFGIGRGMKAKIFPWSIIGLISMVAVVLTVIVTTTGDRGMTYPAFSDNLSTLSVLLVASAASEIISRDIGSGVLSLYFARPLSRVDYAMAKLCAIVTAILLVLGLPQVLMFAGVAFSTKDGFDEIIRELGRLSTGLAHAALHAAVIGSIGALAASLCRRRVFAAVAVVAVFLVSSPIAALLSAANGALGALAGLVSPLHTLQAAGKWLFESGAAVPEYGPVYGLGVIGFVACATLGLIARYRRVKA